MKNQLPEFCTVNTSSTITCPTGASIYVIAATANFTALGQAITVSYPISFSAPLKVTTNITSATAGTIFYYIA